MKKSLFCLVLLLALLPFCTLQAQISTGTYTESATNIVWNITVDDATHTATINGATKGGAQVSGTLNIPGTVVKDGGTTSYTVTEIGSYAFQNHLSITSLILPNSVTSIKNAAFYGCTGLTGTLSLPHVTFIDGSAFGGCSGLTQLSLPSVLTIKDGVFETCTGLTGTLSLPSVTDMGRGAFRWCTGIEQLSLPNVTTIKENTFNNCTGLTQLSLPNVTKIEARAFYDCSGLTQLSIPQIEVIEQEAFYSCHGLTGTLTLPASIKEIGHYAFFYCDNLDAVEFETGTTLTSLGEKIFAWDRNLRYIDMRGVTLPATIKLARPYTSSSPFSWINSYTMVYLPSSSPAAEAGEVNFVIGNTCDHFFIDDMELNYKDGKGTDYRMIAPFTATKATFYRDFQYGTCKTLCLPYPATLPTGMQAYELVKQNHVGRESMMFTAITGNQLEANKPYLVRVISGGSLQFGVDHNVQVPIAPSSFEIPATHDGTVFFCGTVAPIDNTTAAGMNIYNLENNTWKPIRTDNPNGYVHSFRCYIRSTTPIPAGAKGFAIVIDNEGETTGIETAEQDLEQGQGRIYTLDGRFVGTDMDALKSGEVYVKNGRKFYKF